MIPRDLGPVLIIGAGKMGGALLDGWLAQGLAGSSVTVVDPLLAKGRRRELDKRGVCVEADAAAVMDPSPAVMLLAVKPQVMASVLAGAARIAGPETLVISIAAGITLKTLQDAFGKGQPIVRAMPNTPARVGAGITVLCGNRAVSGDQRATAEALFKAVGEIAWIHEETDMDAVTAVSGSGPAYVFLLAECLARAAEEAGLNADLAARLSRQTVIGGGALLAASDLSPATLRENVTSEGGTTAAALTVLTGEDGLEPLMVRAVLAAKARSILLG